ncbi:hypothetical protein HBB16_10045 [Pseudonocardia sp. MCCB 268]|nr:hypothetical protein [Pseudonocardia cytotoxica]
MVPINRGTSGPRRRTASRPGCSATSCRNTRRSLTPMSRWKDGSACSSGPDDDLAVRVRDGVDSVPSSSRQDRGTDHPLHPRETTIEHGPVGATCGADEFSVAQAVCGCPVSHPSSSSAAATAVRHRAAARRAVAPRGRPDVLHAAVACAGDAGPG